MSDVTRKQNCGIRERSLVVCRTIGNGVLATYTRENIFPSTRRIIYLIIAFHLTHRNHYSETCRKAAGEFLIQFSNETKKRAQAQPPLSIRYQSLCSIYCFGCPSPLCVCDKSIWNRCQRQRATDSHVNCQTHVRKRQTEDDFIVVGDSQNFG